jgi:hypothetical protein
VASIAKPKSIARPKAVAKLKTTVKPATTAARKSASTRSSSALKGTLRTVATAKPRTAAKPKAATTKPKVAKPKTATAKPAAAAIKLRRPITRSIAPKRIGVTAKPSARPVSDRPVAAPNRNSGAFGRPGSLPLPATRTADAGEYRDMLAGLIR